MRQIFKLVGVGDLDGCADKDQRNTQKAEEQCSRTLRAWFEFQAEHLVSMCAVPTTNPT